jgi:hypothetical protein
VNPQINPGLYVIPQSLVEADEDLDSSDSSKNSILGDLRNPSEESENSGEELRDKELKRSASPEVTLASARKRRRTSVYETAADTTADGMISLGQSIKDAQLLPPKTRFDQSLEVLNEMKKDGRITSREYFGIVKAFNKQGKEHYSALFVGMTSDLRVEWLVDEELLDR